MESAPLQRVSVAQSDQRQLEGAGSRSCPEGLGERLWTSIGVAKLLESVREYQESRWSRRRAKGSVSQTSTRRQLEGARRHS